METTSPYTPPQTELVSDQEAYGEVKILSASGRIGRLRYIAYSTGLALLFYLIAGMTGAFAGMAMGQEQATMLLGVVFLLGILAALVINVLLTIQRCHDFNASGWLSLILLLPMAPFIFWFIPGTQGGNRYGPRPPPNKNAAIIVVVLLLGIALIGMLAAIAIPAYQGYMAEAEAARAAAGM